jgi:hypothetical protein
LDLVTTAPPETREKAFSADTEMEPRRKAKEENAILIFNYDRM